MLKKDLDALAKKHSNFNVIYALDSAGWLWSGEKGVISASMISKYFPGPKPGCFVYVCGPGGMMKAISGTKAKDFSQGEVDGALKQLGYTKDSVFKF